MHTVFPVHTPTRRGGFTLKELFFILLIAAAIAAVALPAIFRSRERNRALSCLSNQRRVAMAFLQYTQDNNDAYPAGTPGKPAAGWCDDIAVYLFSPGEFQCPEDAHVTPRSLGTPPNVSTYYAVSYGMNSNLGARMQDRANPVPAFWVHPASTASSLSAPAQTVLLFEVGHAAATGQDLFDRKPYRAVPECSPAGNLDLDSQDRYPTGCASDSDDTHIYYATGAVDGRAVNNGQEADARHFGGSNFVACDGHGYWFRPDQVSGGANAATPNSPPTVVALPSPGRHSYRARGTAVGGNMTFSTK